MLPFVVRYHASLFGGGRAPRRCPVCIRL